jgi:transcriptional regulator with XRE-family HTH domain
VIGNVFRRLRRERGITLRELAELAQVSVPYLSEIERGRKEASSEVLAAAAHALGLGLGDLLSLAHGELTRRTGTQHRPAAAPHRPYNGLCLAA